MRLTPFEQKTIVTAIHNKFSKTAKIWLFGSRVDDNKKGGDIDLYVETDHNYPDRWQRKISIISMIQMKIGDQKIDCIVRCPNDAENPIDQIAKKTGILLS